VCVCVRVCVCESVCVCVCVCVCECCTTNPFLLSLFRTHLILHTRATQRTDINRQEEAVVKSGLAADCEDKAAWARVLKLVNTADATVAGKADLARMQKILIQLKNDPIKAK